MPTTMLLNITKAGRLRAQVAAAEGDFPRYWREMAGAMRMLGWSDSADDFDRLADRPVQS